MLLFKYVFQLLASLSSINWELEVLTLKKKQGLNGGGVYPGEGGL